MPICPTQCALPYSIADRITIQAAFDPLVKPQAIARRTRVKQCLYTLPATSPARYKVFFLQQTPWTSPIPVSIFASASRRFRVGGRMRGEFMPGLLFCHIPCVEGIHKPHPKTDGFRGSCVANAQPLAAARGKARARSRGPPLRGAATFLPLFFICRLFLLLSVSSASDSPGKWSRLIKKSSSASCRATRDAGDHPPTGQTELAPGEERKRKEKKTCHTPEQMGVHGHINSVK